MSTNKPLLFSVTCLLLSITLTNIARCTFVMIFPEQAFYAQEIVVKVGIRSWCLPVASVALQIMWLGVQWTLLWTELAVLLFGICFGKIGGRGSTRAYRTCLGPSHSSRQWTKTIKILCLSFVCTCIYVSVQVEPSSLRSPRVKERTCSSRRSSNFVMMLDLFAFKPVPTICILTVV